MPAQVGSRYPVARATRCPSLQGSIAFVRSSVKEVITSTNSNLTMSLLKLLDCFFKPFLPKEVQF